jgi:hypothetical protein
MDCWKAAQMVVQKVALWAVLTVALSVGCWAALKAHP